MSDYRLQSLRAALQLNQEQFGQLLGVHGITISRWETERAFPPPFQAALLERFEVALRKSPPRHIREQLLEHGPIVVLYEMLKASYAETTG